MPPRPLQSRLLSALILAPALVGLLSLGACDTVGDPSHLSRTEGLPIDWTYRFEGDAPTHPPVVVGDSLLLVSGDAYLTCLRLRDGSIKWKTLVDPEMTLLADRLLTDDRRAYGVHYVYRTGETSIRAWTLTTGAEAWRRTYTGDKLALYEGIALSDAYIYLPSDEEGHPAFVLDKRTGAFVFNHHLATADAHLITQKDGILYARRSWVTERDSPQIQTNETRIYALQGDRPDSLWTFATSDGWLSVDPLLADGVMYVGLSTSNSAPGLSYLAVDLATREVLWQTPDVGTMAHLVSGNQIFVREANARMTAIDARSGTIRWQTDTSNSAHASGSPHVLLAGRLYYPHYLGLRVLDADDGELVHVEPLHDGYLWEVVAGAGRIVGQYSGTIVAYHPFGGAGR